MRDLDARRNSQARASRSLFSLLLCLFPRHISPPLPHATYPFGFSSHAPPPSLSLHCSVWLSAAYPAAPSRVSASALGPFAATSPRRLVKRHGGEWWPDSKSATTQHKQACKQRRQTRGQTERKHEARGAGWSCKRIPLATRQSAAPNHDGRRQRLDTETKTRASTAT